MIYFFWFLNQLKCRIFINSSFGNTRLKETYSQGPCNRGKLFYLDPEAGGAGCYCRQEWEAYYWAPLDQCFEQESPGPCQEGQYFAYNATSRQTECNCFKSHVYSPSSRSCVELFTQGKPMALVTTQVVSVKSTFCNKLVTS